MRVVLADDATLFREGLARILSEAGFAVSGQAGDAQGLLRLVRALLKDRISDLAEFAEAVRRVGAGGSVIDPEVVSQLLGRARAPSPLEELTPREREVLALIAEGRSNQAICSKLYVSPKTLDTHVHSIFRKLNLRPAPDDHRRVLAVLTYLLIDRSAVPALLRLSVVCVRRDNSARVQDGYVGVCTRGKTRGATSL